MAITSMSIIIGDLTSDSTAGSKSLVGTKAGDLVVRVFTLNYNNGSAEDLSGAFSKIIPSNDTIMQIAALTPSIALKAVIITPS